MLREGALAYWCPREHNEAHSGDAEDFLKSQKLVPTAVTLEVSNWLG